MSNYRNLDDKFSTFTRGSRRQYDGGGYFTKPTGTVEKCHDLLTLAGFDQVEIKAEQYGSYISLEQAKQMWAGSSHPAPGQFPNPLSQLSSQQLEQVKTEFDAELEALMTEQGIWNDQTIFFTFGRKP